MSDITEHFSGRAALYDKYNTWSKEDVILNSMVDRISRYFHDTGKRKISILDLGAGTGTVSKKILSLFHDRVHIVALDKCSAMLDYAKIDGIEICVAEASAIPYNNNSFDIVISRQCLHYISDLNSVLSEINRVLVDDGIFIFGQIVPPSKDTSEIWCKIAKARQPHLQLRCNYYDSNEWISVISNLYFSLLDNQILSHRISMASWVKSYAVESSDDINAYRSLLINSSEEFQKLSDMHIEASDISYLIFWIIEYFAVRNAPIRNKENGKPKQGTHQFETRNAPIRARNALAAKTISCS